MNPRRSTSAGRLTVTTLLGLLGFTLAGLAQAERLPLVAVVALATGLAPFVGRVGRPVELRIRLQVPARIAWYVGDSYRLVVIVANRGQATTPMLSMALGSQGLDLKPFAVPELRHSEQVSIGQDVALTARRGAAQLDYTVTAYGLLAGRGRQLDSLTGNSLALPSVRPRPDLPPARLVDLLSRPCDEGRGSGRRGAGDPMSLRQFTAGDPVSSVHWRSSARAGSPVVMEREQPMSGLLLLLVAAAGEGAQWEAAVARAAGLVQAAAALAVPVEVLAGSGAPAGEPTHDAVQDWLAGLQDAGAAGQDLVQQAVRAAGAGLVAVLSSDPGLARAVGAGRADVVDLMADPW